MNKSEIDAKIDKQQNNEKKEMVEDNLKNTVKKKYDSKSKKE